LKTEDEYRICSIEKIIEVYGKDYHRWPIRVKIVARRIYIKCDKWARVKIIDLVDLKMNTGFIYFFDPVVIS
jgi:hypothetical protein